MLKHIQPPDRQAGWQEKIVIAKFSRHFSYCVVLQKQPRYKVEFVGRPFKLTEQSLFLIAFLFGQFDPLHFFHRNHKGLSCSEWMVFFCVFFFWDNFQVKEKGFTLE